MFFAIRFNDGSRKLCVSSNGFENASLLNNPAASGFLRKLSRSSDSAIFEYEYHPGNGWGYEVKKYTLDLSNPERPEFSVIDSWIQRR
ncbi:MAG: Uncharacterised protein [Prochlorococcus marinus str. MIT 9215]|nr:MAG: Uncharacterised protein [Prochlorococcus marinus str. MIT 9215]